MAQAQTKSVQKCAEVIEALKIVWPDFNMHTDDLNRPTPASVCKFYEKLLAVMGIDIELITTRLTDHISYPDSFQDIIPCYVLYRCSKGFLERLKLTLAEPFTISDILSPDPKITKIRVMLMANFLLYANNLMAQTLNPIENRVKEELVDIDVMRKELDEIGTETNTLAVELSDIEKSYDELQKEKEACLQEYEEERQMHEGFYKENEILKEESNELEAERSQLLEIFRKEVKKEDELKDLIVEDHETISAERARLEKDIAELESHENNHTENLDVKNDCQLKYDTFAECLEEFLEEDSMESILEMYEAQETKRALIEKMKEELEGLYNFRNNFNSISQQMQEEADALQEEIQAAEVQVDAQEPAVLQECENLEAERDKLALKKTKYDNQTEEIEQKIQYAIECCAQHERNMHEWKEYHGRKYKEILNNTNALHNKVDQYLKEIKSKAEQIKNPFLTT